MPESDNFRASTDAMSPRPGEDSWARKLLGWPLTLALFLGCLALYGCTLRSGVLPADSGEYQRVAATAGVAHPPGYPLYTMLAWVFSRIPIGPTPAWRVNAFSAVTAAATVVLVYRAAREFTHSPLGGIASAAALGSATTFWATGTKASIRPLTAFFTALSLYALARHRSDLRRAEQGPRGREPRDPASLARKPEDRSLSLFFLSLSLGLTHHPSLAFPGVIFLFYLILVDRFLLREPDRWLKPALAVLPGLLVLAYIPLRGGPELATRSGFLEHVLARGFRGDMFALNIVDRLILLPTLMQFQFHRLVLAGMVVGAVILLWQERRLALLLLGSFVVQTAVTLTYDAPQTVEYDVPAYVVAAVLLAVPFGRLTPPAAWAPQGWYRSRALRFASRVLSYLTGAAILVGVFLNVVTHLPSYHSLSQSRDTRDYIADLVACAPQDAVVLANWHWFTPLRYVQEIEGARPDLEVEYVAPRGEPLAQTWVRTIQENIVNRPVVAARVFEQEYSALPYRLEPLGRAFLVRDEHRTTLPQDIVAFDAVLGSQIEVLGYRRLTEDAFPAQPLIVELFWSPVKVPASDLSLFAQLIGTDGRLWSAAEDPLHRAETLSPGEVIVDRFILYPYLHAPPGPYELVVGAYDSDGRLTTGEAGDDLYLETVLLHPSRNRPVTQHRRFVRLGAGPTLIGADYEPGQNGGVRTYLHWMGPGAPTRLTMTGDSDALLTDIFVPDLGRGEYTTIAVDRPGPPAELLALAENHRRRWNLLSPATIQLPPLSPGDRYVPFGDALVLVGVRGPSGALEPGSEVTVRLRLLGRMPLERDLIASTSLTGLKPDGTWAWRTSNDTVPALGAIPTLKWIQGSSILDPHRMGVPADAPSVPIVGSLLIYDHFTQGGLPNLDERLDTAVPLGTWRRAP